MTPRTFLAAAATAILVALPASAADPTLKVGDDGPAFEAKDQDGNPVTSAELYKAGTTLFFFYPKAGTGG